MSQQRRIGDTADMRRTVFDPDEKSRFPHRSTHRTSLVSPSRPESPYKQFGFTQTSDLCLEAGAAGHQLIGIHQVTRMNLVCMKILNRRRVTCHDCDLRKRIPESPPQEKIATGIFFTVIRIAESHIRQSERCGMPVCGTPASALRIRRRPVRICHRTCGPECQQPHIPHIFITGTETLIQHAGIHHVYGTSVQVFAQLKVFIKTDTVRRTVAPNAPERLTRLDRPDSPFPIGNHNRRITLDKSSAREPDKRRRKPRHRLHQIGAQTVRTPFPRLFRKQ